MSERVVAIVQARLGSSRLPCKSLLCLSGIPVIDWVWQRLNTCKNLDEVIFAIPDTSLDRVLAEHLSRMGANYMAGPEQDVLKRMTMAGIQSHADFVVRICADNPLVSGSALDSLVEFYWQSGCDYAWNHIPRDNMWPDGLGGEMVSMELLARLEREAALPSQREHCFNYIWDNVHLFSMATFDPEEKWLRRPEIRLDIDSVADFERLSLMHLAPGMADSEIITAWDRTH